MSAPTSISPDRGQPPPGAARAGFLADRIAERTFEKRAQSVSVTSHPPATTVIETTYLGVLSMWLAYGSLAEVGQCAAHS
jgi:hypothetical protein